MGSFNTSLSALKAFSTAISAVGNNLANINSNGFKDSDVNFQDLMGSISNGNTQIGNGVQQPSTDRSFSQGTITTTNNALDAAIQGNGFFLLTPAGSTGVVSPNAYEYTRDGHFQLSPNGTLVSQDGSHVQGWSVNPTTGKVDTTGTIGDITVPLGTTLPPVPTSTLGVSANLNSATAAGDSMSIPVTVYDALGGSHQLTLKLTKGSTAGAWDIGLSSTDPTIQNGTDLSSLLSVKTLTFTNGALDPATPAAINITGLKFTTASGIPAQPVIVWSPWTTVPSGSPAAGGVSGLTQYSQASAITSVTQNGVPPGSLSNVQIANGGVVLATFSNGAQLQIGQLAIGGAQNPESLVDIGNNEYRAGATTVALPASVPQTGGEGQIIGESLESSNVDIATEFTNLISFQRGYQANSRVITTQNQMTQDLLNLIQ